MSQVTFDGDATKTSRYFKRFQRLNELRTEYPEPNPGSGEPYISSRGELSPMVLKGDMLIVERLPKIELKTSSGIILPHDMKTYKDTHSDRVTDFGLVLMTGPGHVFDDGSSAPCDCKPGDVILLPGNVAWYSAFGTMADYEAYSIGLVRDAQVILHFNDYVKAMEVLNANDQI